MGHLEREVTVVYSLHYLMLLRQMYVSFGLNLSQVRDNISLESSEILSNSRSFLKRQTDFNKQNLFSLIYILISEAEIMGVNSQYITSFKRNYRWSSPSEDTSLRTQERTHERGTPDHLPAPESRMPTHSTTNRVKTYFSSFLCSVKESETTDGPEKVKGKSFWTSVFEFPCIYRWS